MTNMFHHLLDLNMMAREEAAAWKIRNLLVENPNASNQDLLEILRKVESEQQDRKKLDDFLQRNQR